jgi:S-disulfanyl-L-cysteine oxidoreductase SoxD
MRTSLFIFIAAVFTAIALNAQQTNTTVLDGVYSLSQAEKGEKLYDNNCIRCHEGNDPEGPTLKGRTFIERWREDHLDVLFDYIRKRMPADDAGKLSDIEYLEILAYLIEANGYGPGTRDLTVQGLPAIRLVGPDGPKPLPTNTLVRIVGCLVQTSDQEWSLTQATEPVRSRQGTESSPEELKKSAAEPLGTMSFRVTNFTNIRFDFKPDPFKNQKVQIKGVLLRTGTNERISLTSLESVAPVCGS